MNEWISVCELVDHSALWLIAFMHSCMQLCKNVIYAGEVGSYDKTMERKYISSSDDPIISHWWSKDFYKL